MEKKSIHSYIRAHVVVLDNAALNQVQISKQLKASRSCAQHAIKKYKQLGRFDDLKHTGHKKTVFWS